MKAKVVCRALVAAALLAGWSVGSAATQQDQVQAKDQRLQVLLKQFNEAYKAGRYAEAQRLAATACEIDPTSGPAQAACELARVMQGVADYTAELNELAAGRAAVEQKQAELKVQLASLDEKADKLRERMKALEAEKERLLARIKQGKGREAAGPGSAPAGDKLDKILQKLDALEKRLADLEKKVK
jgi:chromosome segregation ATPase